MAAELTGLRPPRPDPPEHVCAACGSTRDACFGFPNDVWFCHPCVPTELRRPGSPGYRAPAAEAAPAAASAPAANVVTFLARAGCPAAPAPAPDLFGPGPA